MPSAPYVGGGAAGVVTITAGGRINDRRLTALIADLPHRAERVAEVHAELVRHWAIAFAPVQENNDQGFKQNERHLTIREGIVKRKIGPARYAIVATAPQSAPQEFGSEAHDITPREQFVGAVGGGVRRNYLHFYWQREGHWARMAAVHHPGNPPHPFMLPARRRVAATFYRELRRMFDENGVSWKVAR